MSPILPRPLKPKQRQAAQMIGYNWSQADIAKRLNLRRETLSRWKQNPEFIAETERCQQEQHEHAMREMGGLFDATIVALARALNDYDQRSKVAIELLKLFGAERLQTAALERLTISHTNP
jgi:transcriptional regulator with XRE-family HTH domain